MKRLTWLAAALTAVVLSFVGCPNPVSDATDPSGVFGRVVGVVYDEVSGLPIKDAKVAIDGYGVISTNENGTYIFEDVIPGNYLITVSAPGYSAYSVRTNVNAERYLEDDPFMEADNLRKQIDLFSEWVAAYQAANGSDAYPAYGEGTTGYLGSNTDNSWYYQDGVYVSEDGSVSISSTGTDPAFPTFQVTYNRLDDYTYRYGIDAGVIRLKPRSGGFEGKIEVAFEVHNSVVQVTDTKPAKGVSVYFIDAAANGVTISDTWNGSTDKTADRVYGPFYTDDNGYFKASELPAKTDFFVVISPFSQTKDGIDYYFNPQVAYTPGDWANPIVIGTTATDHDNDTATPDIDPTPFSTATGNKVTVGEQEYDEEWNPLPIEITEEGFVNIGKLVFFTVGNVAYVTGGNVPNAHSPLAVTDAITLKFNREIAVGELVATLTFESGNAVVYGDSNSSDPNEQPETEQILSVVGSRSVSDGFEVSLEPKAKLKEYSKISLAYSVDEGKPLAKLKVDGKAKDGSQIYQAGAIPVYTREGLKLVQYEYLSAAVAASQRSNTVKTEVGGAIKLIFNKPLSKTYSGTTFTINGHPADYRFDPTNPNAVVVFTDWEVSEAATVNFTVVSEADTGDALYNETFDASLTVGAGIQLILKSTNLYTNAQGVAFGPDAAADAIFPVDGKIVFTFVDIPEGAKASVELKNGSEIVPLDKPPEVSSTAETLTITPSRIEVGGTYTIKVKITDANDVTLWTPKNGTLVNVGLPSEDPAPPNPDEGLIKFKSSDLNTLSLLKTNLYTDYNGIARTPSDSVKIFPVDKSIEFTFNNLDGVIVAAELEKVVSSPGTNVSVYTGTPVVAGNTVTITPARLEPGQKYTLVLRIAGEDGLILWGVPTLYDNATPPQPKAGQAGPIYVTASNKIEFTTSEDLQLALLSTNLYTDPTETNLGQEKIVQPSTSNGGVFGIGTAIELNFDDIPDGAKVSAILRKGTAATGIINARVLPSDNTVTVTPAQPLELDTEYTLAVRIYDGNRTLWSVPTATDTTGSSTGVVWIKKSIALEADSRIVFRTASKQQYLITGTNLYFDPETGEVKPPANNLKNFATNGVIELYFNELPAGATVKNLVLKNAAGGDITVASAVNVDAKTITVTLGAGVVLDANKLYYLSLRVVPYPESNTAIWTVANDPGSFINRVNTLGVDGKSYIVFNTVEADTAELVSAANLYDEDDPVLYAEPKFALNGTIELTFKAGSIPANARIGISELRATNYTSALLPSYSVLDHANSKVTIKPESPLTHTTKYYLRLTLTKPGQNEPVWEPVTYAGIIPTDPDDLSRPLNEAQSKGVSGPVYIEYKGSSAASGRGYIVFTSAPKLDIINAATTNVSNITVTKQFDNVTDQPNGIDTQNFNPNNNIIIQFNLPIKTVNKAQVWLFRNGSTRGTTGSADATKLRNDRKVLDIEIPYRLAANETFKIRIDVVSDDDQVLRYDSSNTTTATGDDINLRTSGLTTGSKGVNTISGLTFNGVQNPFGNTTDSVPITFTPPSLNIAVEYFVLTGRQNSWEATGTSIGTVSMSSVAPRNGNAVLQTRNPNEVRFNDELNQIKIRGISNQGYVTESNVLTLTFN